MSPFAKESSLLLHWAALNRLDLAPLLNPPVIIHH